MSTSAATTHPNVEILRAVYADLTRLEDYASDDMILHSAERTDDDGRYVGRHAAVTKEHDLIRMTGGTLVMDVEKVVANDCFGAVLGVLRAHRDGHVLAVPFCGLWRFRDGLIAEHWENAYDVPAIAHFLAE
jgi:ketosteroid isomerase-like protein